MSAAAECAEIPASNIDCSIAVDDAADEVAVVSTTEFVRRVGEQSMPALGIVAVA